MSDPLLVHFEDLETGQVVPLGACAVDQAALDAHCASEHFRRLVPQIDAFQAKPGTYILMDSAV